MSNGIHFGAIRKFFHDITDVNSIHSSSSLNSSLPFQLGRDAARPIVDFLAVLSSSLLSFCSYRRRRVLNIWWAGPATHLQYQSLVICLLFRRTLPARGLRILGSQRSMVCHMLSSITELAVDFTISSYCAPCAPPRPRHCARAWQFCVFSAHISRNCYNYCATLRWESMLFFFVFGDSYVISSVLFATQGYWFSVFEFLLILLSIFPRSIGMCESQRLRPSTPPTPWRHVRG